MFTSKLIKNILSLVFIAAVIFLGFRYVTRPPAETLDQSSEIGVSSTSVDDPANMADVFSELLDKLAKVDFQKDRPIFNDPVFKNGLVSFSRELPLIDRVRINPFAPIEGNPASYIRYAPAEKKAATTTLTSFTSTTTTIATSSRR